jgi:glucokinase
VSKEQTSVEGGLALGVDIGGTKTAVLVVDSDGVVVDRALCPTPGHDADEIERAVARLAAELRARHEVVAVGVGAAGYIDAAGDTVLAATHLAWVDEPLRAKLEARTGLPVHVENDATAAAWAEHRFGAGRGCDPMLMVTVGTGVGGGIVVGGGLLRGWTGVGAEIGHTVLERDGRPCACGDRGCLEQYASGKALVREARAMAADHEGVAHALLALAGGDPQAIEGPMVTAAARDGDLVAVRSLALVGTALGRGIASLVNVLDPQRVVVGGGVADAGELLLGPAREEMAKHVVGRAHRALPELVGAELNNAAGAVGAADLARLRVAL